MISIHKALASLDSGHASHLISCCFISIHKALASLDLLILLFQAVILISIHKALASLDSRE